MDKLRVSSYYNQVSIGDGTTLIFNGRTMSIDIVPDDYAKELSAGSLSFLSEEEKKHLEKRGHLTSLTYEHEAEETKKLIRFVLKESAKARRRKKRKLGLSFILTYDCNLSCHYCYQGKLAGKSQIPTMSSEFVEKFFSVHLSQIYPGVPIENLHFVLFGGEPLLSKNRDAIERILHYAKKHSIRVMTSTNTVNLEAMTDLIGSETGKIQSVQVTLDGDRSLHDKQRIPVSGKPTFDAMIASIRKLIQLGVSISIRVHLHPGEVESAERLARYLEEEKILGSPGVEVYFIPINDFEIKEMSPGDIKLFSRVFQEVAAKTKFPPAVNLDFMGDVVNMETLNFVPKVRFCCLGGEGTCIVDSLGDIYDCYEQAGYKEFRIGTVSGGKPEFFPEKEVHSRRNLLNLPECLSCSVAFFCGGGCPNQSLLQKGSLFEPYCQQNKLYIGQALKAYFLIKGNGKA